MVNRSRIQRQVNEWEGVVNNSKRKVRGEEQWQQEVLVMHECRVCGRGGSLRYLRGLVKHEQGKKGT